MSPDAPAGSRPLQVLGIAGSLRTGSYNVALLRAAIELAPKGMDVRVFSRIGELPLYNADLEKGSCPDAVAALRGELAASDAVLFVTPEYNHGVPGVLKNALDWASRPPTTTPLHGMPAGIMGAATGMVGTARAQLQLRQALVYTHTYPLAAPEVLVARAQDKFDANGRLQDEPTRKFIADYMESLRQWTIRLRRPAE
ncbi:MAG TPA: NAD(P)H-dependent oxidoreductase [Gemmatimonadaceae bacterium]|jgi:chromate reductase|nr:NAD(P)H-dependent oxidoreductase [Gemmatimonadaceae bacterium]